MLPDRAARAAGLSRRTALRYSALAAVLGPGMAGCARDQPGSGGQGTASALRIASPGNPVTWPISTDNQPIPAGTKPEQGATLQLYNYPDYLSPDVVRSFERKYRRYDVTVKVSTFNDAGEALTKIRAGSVPFDIYFPSYDAIGKLAGTGLIRPLTHDYLPGITNVWPEFLNPFYDSGWRYSIPYMIYTTGIAWRTDTIDEDLGNRANPWDVFWDPRYTGQLAVLDDYRETISMTLLRNGARDLNTGSQAALEQVQADLLTLTRTTRPTVTINSYADLPGGRFGISHAWSGDAVNMPYYLPEGGDPGVLRYWFPENGLGLVNHDLAVLLRSGRNPVLGHLFLEHLLDPETALANLSATGYQPPQNTLTAKKLVAEGYIPANLASAAVDPAAFGTGFRTLELPPEVDARWQAVWQRFKAGG